MYQDYFNFNTLPFENTPNPDFFFMGARYRETLALMKHSVMNRKGLICISGPIGCGKTTLATALIDHLPKETKIISVHPPSATPKELILFIAQSLGIDMANDSPVKLHQLIHAELIRINEAGEMSVLIMDESQCMSDELFQEILFLANLETKNYKLLQIILLGQEELLEKMNDPQRRQLAQRISVLQVIEPMREDQARAYIEHRLKVAGGSPTVFSDAASAFIISKSKGIPRILNKLCDAALLNAFIANRTAVEAADAERGLSPLGMNLFNDDPRPLSKVPVQYSPSRQPALFQNAGYSPPPELNPVEKVPPAPLPQEAPKKELHKNATVINQILGSQWLRVALVLLVILFLITGIISHFETGGQKPEEPGHVKSAIQSGQESTEPSSSPVAKVSEVPAKPSLESYDPAMQKPEVVPEGSENEEKTADSDQPESIPVPSDPTALEEARASAAAHPEIKPLLNEEVPFSLDEPDDETQSASHPYSILLGTFRTRTDAANLQKIYAEKGISSYLVQVDLGDTGVWFRLFTGYFENAVQAEAAIEAKQLSGALIKKTEYAGLIASDASPSEITDKMASLIKSGLSPYIIKEKDGNSKLYIGAFYTKIGADSHCSDLAGRGIQCQAVRR